MECSVCTEYLDNTEKSLCKRCDRITGVFLFFIVFNLMLVIFTLLDPLLGLWG